MTRKPAKSKLAKAIRNRDLSVESKRLTLQEAQSYFNLTAYIWQSISGGLSFGVVIGAIVAYILKTKTPDTTIKTK